MHQQQQRNPSLSSGVPASVTGLQQQVQVQQLPGSTAAMASPPHPTGNLSASARQPQPQNGKSLEQSTTFFNFIRQSEPIRVFFPLTT